MPGELVVGCYTLGDYAEVAKDHLLKSVNALGLPYIIQEIPDRGFWVLNNSACQLFLRSMESEWPEDDFLYVDVDGEVHSDPWPFLRTLRGKCDVAAYLLDGKELLSGTLYLPAGPNRIRLLNQWIARNEENPGRWDQKNLQTLIGENPEFRFARLPAEYCCIFDLQRKRTPDIVPVIEHFQASRKFKDGTWAPR